MNKILDQFTDAKIQAKPASIPVLRHRLRRLAEGRCNCAAHNPLAPGKTRCPRCLKRKARLAHKIYKRKRKLVTKRYRTLRAKGWTRAEAQKLMWEKVPTATTAEGTRPPDALQRPTEP